MLGNSKENRERNFKMKCKVGSNCETSLKMN